jgi:hypothetical protein
MEILEDKVITKYLFEKYCSNPRNWNFVISRSSLSDGFFDATISSTDEVWQLKIDSIYKPVPMLIGTKIDIDSTTIQRKINTDSAPFGYRKLDVPMITDIFKKLNQEQEQQKNIPTETDFNNYFYSILGSLKTVRPVRGENYAYGPVVFTEKNPVNTNEYQKQVSEKLAFKLRDNLRSKYLSYG